MFGVSKIIFNVLLIISVGLAYPVWSPSQEQNEISAEGIDTENLTSDVGLPTLDEIKEIEAKLESDVAAAKKKIQSAGRSVKILRLDVPIGIAYGSDTALAKKLLLKVAEDNPEVLDKPEPSALFLGFGNNSLNFELRVFIDDPMKRFDIMDKRHLTIDDAFRKADVTIAFPQRDMHLDQIGPLEMRVLKQEIDKLPKI